METDESFIPESEFRQKLDTSIISLGCSPMKSSRIGTRGKVSYGKRKLSSVSSKLKETVASALSIPEESLETEERAQICVKCKDFDKLLQGLERKMFNISQTKTN